MEFSPWHWVVVLVVAGILFFGWKQLPEMSRSLGRSLRIFKSEMKEMTDDRAKPEAESSAAQQASAPKELPKAEIIAPAARPRPRPTPSGSDRAR